MRAVFPSNYSVIRKYRQFDNSKGGVFIAMKNDLIGTHRTDLDNKCEHFGFTINKSHEDNGVEPFIVIVLVRSPCVQGLN